MFDRNKFCVFIISHGRPNNVKTYKTIRRSGYSGKVYIVVDDKDDSIDEYKIAYCNEVIVFDKDKYIRETDGGDNFKEHKSPVYARNAIWDIARQVGVDYFVVFDDDYYFFELRYDGQFRPATKGLVVLLDDAIAAMVKFLEASKIHCIAFSQGGDFIGGARGKKKIPVKRKVMNSFFCATSRPFRYMSKLNDDVTTYIVNGSRGLVFLTTYMLSLDQEDTQQNNGGLTDLYLQYGTYVKSFYTIMFAPSCVRINMVGDSRKRLHHNVIWGNAVPKIIRSDAKKA